MAGWGKDAKVFRPEGSHVGPDRRIHRTAALRDPYSPRTATGTDNPHPVTRAGANHDFYAALDMPFATLVGQISAAYQA